MEKDGADGNSWTESCSTRFHKLAEGVKQTSLYRCVLNEQESHLRRGLVFTGRQALFTIYRFYEVNKDTATIVNIEGLMSLRHPGHMEQFYNNWNENMTYQRPNLSDLELATTLWRSSRTVAIQRYRY